MSDPLLSTIPRETLAFLREGRQLEDRPDPGVRKSVRLRDVSSLQVDWLPVTSEETEFEAEDPQCYGGGDSVDRNRDDWLRIKDSGLATDQLKAIIAAFSPYAVR